MVISAESHSDSILVQDGGIFTARNGQKFLNRDDQRNEHAEVCSQHLVQCVDGVDQ